MYNDFCITTLTHTAEGRPELLRETVRSLVDGTDFEQIVPYFILINGPVDPFKQVLEEINKLVEGKLEVTVLKTPGEKNLGVGAGINMLNQHMENSCIHTTLFLEGDWLLLPPSISKSNKKWLTTCLEQMYRDPGLEYIQLRRYLDDIDHRQFRYAHWIQKNNINKIENLNESKFIYLNEREYANPPHIRYNPAFVNKGVYPLKEFIENGEPTEHKGHENWGKAEIEAQEAGKRLNTAFFDMGIFVHADGWQYGFENWEKAESSFKNCGKYDIGCKYGFLRSRKMFCQCCNADDDFTGLFEHNNFFEQVVIQEISHDIKDHELDEVTVLMHKHGKTPEI